MAYPSNSTRRVVEPPQVFDQDLERHCKDIDLGATGSTIASCDADFTPLSDDDVKTSTVWRSATTIIIFDWDDTLLPSSHLAHLGVDLFDPNTPARICLQHPQIHDNLTSIDHVASELLESASQLGRVAIVTNAERGWVELSSSRYMPRTFLALRRLNVLVISARSKYATTETSASAWKLRAFEELLVEQPVTPQNVLSFGDSECERYALLNTVTPPAFSKSFKFLEGPNAATLLVELRWISEILDRMTRQNGSLDLMFNYNKPQ